MDAEYLKSQIQKISWEINSGVEFLEFLEQQNLFAMRLTIGTSGNLQKEMSLTGPALNEKIKPAMLSFVARLNYENLKLKEEYLRLLQGGETKIIE